MPMTRTRSSTIRLAPARSPDSSTTNRFDGGATLASLPKQDDVLLELGYFIAAVKLTPVVQWTNRDIADVTKGDEKHWSVGLNYWWAGQNANVKAAYSRITPFGQPNQNEFHRSAPAVLLLADRDN